MQTVQLALKAQQGNCNLSNALSGKNVDDFVTRELEKTSGRRKDQS